MANRSPRQTRPASSCAASTPKRDESPRKMDLLTVRRRLDPADQLGNWSRTGFVDHRFPNAFGFENEFNRLADRAMTGERFRCVVRRLFNLRNRIAHRNGKASAAHNG